MDRVQWVNEAGGYEIGRIFVSDRGETDKWYVTKHGLKLDRHVQLDWEVLVLPYHGGEPVFVEFGKLTPRPVKEVLDAAK